MTLVDTERAFAVLDEFIRKKMDLGSIPGLAVGVTDRERLLGCRYHGFSNIDAGTAPGPDTLFEIGSISKSFASVVALQLVEEGLLDLHRPVDEYLPWLEARWKGDRFTMHHLMSHTAGLPIGPEATPEAVSEVWAIREVELGCPPGQFFHYSNVGYKIVGLVIEEVTGQSCAKAIEDRILAPLGMTRSRAVIDHALRPFLATPYGPSPDDRHVRRGTRMMPAPWLDSESADGSICSTPEEMAAYIRVLLNRGAYPGGPMISSESVTALTNPVIRAGDSSHDGHYAYGLGVERSDGRTVIAHTGGMVGYISAMRLDLGAGIGVIVLTNGATDVDDVASFALRAFCASSSDAKDLLEDLPYSLGPDEVDQYVGAYRSQLGSLEVRTDGRDGLVLVSRGMSGTLQPRGKDSFSSDLPEFDMFLLKFRRGEEGVSEVWCGGEVYARDGRGEEGRATVSDDLLACCGHYRSSNPWLTNFRVLARKGLLWLAMPSGEERELVTLGNHAFRIGLDERSPERIVFGAFVKGKAQRADVSGQLYGRTRAP